MKITILLVFGVICLGFISCEEAGSEFISLEDMQQEKVDLKDKGKELWKMKNEIDAIVEEEPLPEVDSLAYWLEALRSVYLFSKLEKSSKLDRYELVSKEKLQVSSKVESIEKGENDLFEITHHAFSDSLKCKSAFYNWLDCFGKECAEIKMNKDTFGLNRERVLVIATENEIEAIKSPSSTPNNWKRVKSILLAKYKGKIKHQFEIDKWGRLKWKKIN